MKRFLLLVAACFVAGAAYAQPPMQPMRMISVQGQAHMEVAPDQAELHVSLVSRNIDLNEAKRANDKLTKSVRNIALDMKIPEKNIATSHVHVSPQYNWRNNQQELKGYMVNRSLNITMDSIDTHERLLSELIAAGVDQVGGVNFKLAKPDSYEAKLRIEAVKDAAAKAKVLADAAGVELGKPISITVGGASAMPYPVPMARMAMAEDVSAAGSNSVAPALPGMIRLEETVSIVYEIR